MGEVRSSMIGSSSQSTSKQKPGGGEYVLYRAPVKMSDGLPGKKILYFNPAPIQKRGAISLT